MIKAIIFDCFGVLVTEGWHPLLDDYFSNSAEQRNTAIKIHNDANRGAINFQTYSEKLAKLGGVSQELISEYLDRSRPNRKLLDYIETQLKPNYKVAILSNASNDWLKDLLTPEQINLFDDIVLSYKTNFIKPEPAIYKLILDNLKVEPSEVIFIDDSQRQIEGGKNVGIKSILYQDFDQMKNDLEKLLAKA